MALRLAAESRNVEADRQECRRAQGDSAANTVAIECRLFTSACRKDESPA